MYQSVLIALREFGWAEVRNYYNADCCIDATTIVMDVLDYCGEKARPLCTKANIWNKSASEFVEKHGSPAYQTSPPEQLAEWEEKRCKWVAVGYATGAPGGYAGHLVALAPGLLGAEPILIDISLAQANRPDHDIVIPCIFAATTPEFLEGEESLCLEVNGSSVWYEAEPGRDDYLQTPAWHHTKLRQPVVREIIRHAKRIERGI